MFNFSLLDFRHSNFISKTISLVNYQTDYDSLTLWAQQFFCINTLI